MKLALLNMAVALFLGFGAVEEFIMRGVRGGETQPLVVGLAGMLVSLLLIVSGVALWRRGPNARSLTLLAAVSSVLFHVYAALPPHRNVGMLALLVGAGYGLVLLGLVLSSTGRRAPAV